MKHLLLAPFLLGFISPVSAESVWLVLKYAGWNWHNGSGLEKIIDQNAEVPGITDIIFSPDIYVPITAFFILILITIFLRKFFYKN